MNRNYAFYAKGVAWVCMLCLIFVSCSPGDQQLDQMVAQQEPVLKSFPQVDEALWPYFRTFEEEAAERRIRIDINSLHITGEISDLDGERVAGQCNYHGRRPNHVTVDSEFWRRASANLREMIVYHELGHCVLYRGHTEEILPNGICASIMRSGSEGCRDNYNFFTREFYINELFENQQLN